jgi:hypothetical protein
MSLILHSLVYGLILSGLLAVLMLASLFWNPAIWAGDYPPDIKVRFGPPDARTQRQKWIVAAPFFLVLIGAPTAAVLALPAAGVSLNFGTVFACAFVVVFVFNLVDLLVMDWLIFVTWQPRQIVLPGTAGMAGYRDYAFHFRGFLIGLVLCLFAGLVAGGIYSVAAWLG